MSRKRDVDPIRETFDYYQRLARNPKAKAPWEKPNEGYYRRFGEQVERLSKENASDTDDSATS